MDITEFLHSVDHNSVGGERFPFYLKKEQATQLYNLTPEKDIELYNNTLLEFIDTGEIKDKEILKYSINQLLLLLHANSVG